MHLALGLAPIVATPGCWCPDPPNGEHALEELVERRDLIQQGARMREAGCRELAGSSSGGSSGLGELPEFGGAGGLGGSEGFGGADGFAGGDGFGGATSWGGATGLGGAEGSPGMDDPSAVPEVCGETFPDWVQTDYPYWHEENITRALSWDPSSGCPTTVQYDALMQTLEYTYAEAIELLSSADGVCVYKRVQYCPGGRPFLVEGQARVAALRRKGGRARPGDPIREALAAAFSADALAEHASIAAFARLSLQLMAHGAPLDLIVRSQRASLDEARHAALCLREARRHAGTKLDWAPLPLEDARLTVTEEELLITNVLEGCIGETLAAAHARARAAGARSQRLQKELLRLAEDEERHATLAFGILRWQLERSPALRATALATFREFQPPVRQPTPAEADARWQAAGLLRAADMSAIDWAVWHSAIVPLAARLLHEDASPRASPVRTRSRDCTS